MVRRRREAVPSALPGRRDHPGARSAGDGSAAGRSGAGAGAAGVRGRPPVWIEVALAAGGFPAAGERLRADTAATGEWRMPEEIWRRLPPGELWLRGVDAGGRESSPLHLRRGASSAAEGPA